MRPAVGLSIAAVLITASCFRYGAAPLTPDPGTRVRVLFPAPTTVHLQPAGWPSDAVPPDIHEDVVDLEGVISAVGADTLTVIVHTLHTARGAEVEIRDRVTSLPIARIGQVERRRLDTTSTIVLSVVALGVAGTLYLFYWLVTWISLI